MRHLAGLVVTVAVALPALADGKDPKRGLLEVRVEGCPCTVRIDGQDAGTAQTVGARMATFEIAPGPHVVEASSPGGARSVRGEVKVKAGVRSLVELRMPPDPQLVAPRLLRDVEVELPPGVGPQQPDNVRIEGVSRQRTLNHELPYGCRPGLSAVVVAVLTVDTSGHVSDVAIVSKPSPFDSAIRAAMSQRLYSPATIGGVPAEGSDLELFKFSGGVAENDAKPGGLR